MNRKSNRRRIEGFDPRGWLVWLASGAGLAMLLRNPWYSLGLFLAAQIVKRVNGRQDAPLPLSLGKLAGFLLPFAALFNMLSAHAGATVIFRLPAGWPWVGGPITLEAAAAGLANGLLLLALLALFATFNQVVTTADLARLTPRAFRDVGVVVLIAMTAVPETIRHLRRIQEAQAIRGHRLRGLSDWRPVLLPLLVGGLERAMGLAETMVARGYGAAADVRHPVGRQVGLLAGLTAVFGGWTLAFWQGWPGWLLMAAGGGWLALLLWRIGRQTPHTRYQARGWRRRDWLLVITAVLPWLALLFGDRSGVIYAPFPRLSLPDFNPLLGVGLISLLYPALWRRSRRG